MRVFAWGMTDTGRKRDHNEDSFLVDNAARLYAVADGMGGHQGGGTASRMVLEMLHRRVRASLEDPNRAYDDTLPTVQEGSMAARGAGFGEDAAPLSPALLNRAESEPPPFEDAATEPMLLLTAPPAIEMMAAAATAASAAIYEVAGGNADLRGMGTTLTAMMYDGGRMHIIHAGDSRAYLFRDNRIRQLTEDHSWIWEQMKLGVITEAEAKESKYRHVITRSVGFEREVELDTLGVAVEAGDCFLLCSDGMTNHIDDDELTRLLATTWFRRVPERLIELANQRGGDDNITVIAVHVANHKVDEEAAGGDPDRSPTVPGTPEADDEG